MSKRTLAVLVGIWAIAVSYMVARGRTDSVTIGTDVIFPLIFLLAGWLTVRLAPGRPEPIPRPHEGRPRVILQLCVIGAAIVLTGIRGMNFHGVTAITIPGWTWLLRQFARSAAVFGLANEGANFGSYVLVPGLLVLLLGARFREIGFARPAPRTGRLAVPWLAFPAAAWIFALIKLHVGVPFMIFAIVRNFFSNGISEEFLWRGLLFTRLRAIVSTEAALWIQATLFGLWHFGYDFSSSHNDLGLMLADMFASQVVLGYAFGWLMVRTRNLWLSTAVHLAFDSLGDAFGAI